MAVVVYSKNNCPGCVALKRELAQKGIEFEEVRVDLNQEARVFLMNEGFRSVPQVFVDGVHTDPNTLLGKEVG